ncbi:hypothetical protein CsatB_012559 [Cannabis sativa]
MGNCVQVMSSYQSINNDDIVRVVSYNGEILRFKGLTPVNKIITSYVGYILVHHSQPFSPLSPKTKLEAGEVYFLVPELVLFNILTCPKRAEGENNNNNQDHDQIISYNNKSQKIKIKITREQLEFLLQCQTKGFSNSAYSYGNEQGPSPKWRPSLTSIAEAHE